MFRKAGRSAVSQITITGQFFFNSGRHEGKSFPEFCVQFLSFEFLYIYYIFIYTVVCVCFCMCLCVNVCVIILLHMRIVFEVSIVYEAGKCLKYGSC